MRVMAGNGGRGGGGRSTRLDIRFQTGWQSFPIALRSRDQIGSGKRSCDQIGYRK